MRSEKKIGIFVAVCFIFVFRSTVEINHGAVVFILTFRQENEFPLDLCFDAVAYCFWIFSMPANNVTCEHQLH